MQPDSTGLNTYQYPIEEIFVPLLTAMSAVAPPGGCSVRVCCIQTIDNATAKGAVSQIISGRSCATVTPAIAETTWPPIKLRGCASGLCMAP
ncbi:hypothetical protein D3C87_139580 [compost metagenome]